MYRGRLPPALDTCDMLLRGYIYDKVSHCMQKGHTSRHDARN